MNQTPEQIVRDNIDRQLIASGWVIQNKKQMNLNAGLGVAVREYQTDAGPADYVLFVDVKPVGIIEAKREEEGVRLTAHEDQSKFYADSKLKYLNNDPLPFVYESTGQLTRFTDYSDPKPRSRPAYSFHRPETFQEWFKRGKSLRQRFFDIPDLQTSGLRECQIIAIHNLEDSFRRNQPKALIQMATGSGKTFTAITFIYRLLKYAKAKRVLFLVDTKNLGEQAEQEFMAYMPNDDNRKFTELYGVHRLKSSFVPTDNQVNGQPKNELIALVALIRKVAGIDSTLTDYDKTVNRNFQQWILKKNAGKHNRFTEEQMHWLRMLKDHIAASVHVDSDDLDYTPFDAQGGKGKMWQLFGDEMNTIIDEMNEVLAA